MHYLSFKDITYEVDHAVKGADFIHGYNAKSERVVAFEGITDFSIFEYDGEYLAPEECLAEMCNSVKYFAGTFVRPDGTPIHPRGLEMHSWKNIAGKTTEYTLDRKGTSVYLISAKLMYKPFLAIVFAQNLANDVNVVQTILTPHNEGDEAVTVSCSDKASVTFCVPQYSIGFIACLDGDSILGGFDQL